MNAFARWWRFNLIGVAGAGVQLAALALFNRIAPGHYMYATAAAIELAVLHNFVWHVRVTWRDRQHGASLRTQLVRFHLANGLVSMTGNLALMPLLVEHARLPLLVANLTAIACCSIVNFLLSHNWAFATHPARWPERQTLRSATAETHRALLIPRRRTMGDDDAD